MWKIQASEMNLDTAKPEDVIKKEWLNSYTNFHKDIYHRLVHINTSIRIFDTIRQYPLYPLYGPNQGIFWHMVYWNFLYSSIVLLHGLVNDEGPDVLTISRFKNLLQQKGLIDDSTIKDLFKKRVKEAEFSAKNDDICKKIEAMRHTVIAHRLFDEENGCISSVPGVAFEEISKVCQAIEKLFAVCSFGVECITNFYLPTMTDPHPPAEDVKDILDLLIKNSCWLNHPEHRGDFWLSERQQRSTSELEELNLWRQKFGLPRA